MPSPADSPGWPRRLARFAAWAGGAVLLLGLAVYAGFPWLASTLAPRLADALGVEVLEIEVHRPGLSTLTIERLRVVSGRLEARADAVAVAFRPLALLRGQLESVGVTRLALRLAEPPAAVPAAAPAAVPAPDTWLAAVPAGRVSVTDLRLAVPALGFRAAGGLELDGPALLLHLAGRAPAAAEGMTLAASLTRDGRIGASLTAPAATSAFLALSSAVDTAAAGERLTLRGSLDLRGFPLALVQTLAGLPAGDGRVIGSFTATLPWPPPETPDWSSPAGGGELAVDWRPDAGDWQLQGVAASWRIGGGRLAAELSGSVAVAQQTFAVHGRVREWRLPLGGGGGELTVSLPPDSNDRPVLSASWDVAPDALDLDGSLEIDGALFDQLARRLELPQGDGRARVAFDARLPWPLKPGPLGLADLGITAAGSVSGGWQPAGDGPGLAQLDGRWRVDAATLAASADAKLAYRGLRAGLAVTVERLALGARRPAAAGSVSLGAAGALDFTVEPAASGALAATLSGTLDAGAGAGLLGGSIADWPGEFDATAGSIGLDAELGWQDATLLGSVRVDLDDVSAHYQSYTLTGLQATLGLEGTSAGWHLPVTPLQVARVDTGVALRHVDGGIGWRGDVVEVQATSAELLGGRASVEPFEYSLANGSARFRITFDDLDLSEVLALQGEQVQGSGTLDGGLPIRIEDGRLSISGGRLHADAPGGMLRVSQSLASGSGQPGLDFALRALQNFDYRVLTADVDYAPAGDLTLAVHLEGRNPAIEQGRPIHYNVTVNQNLPVLLESLRLQQNVTRNIERRLNN